MEFIRRKRGWPRAALAGFFIAISPLHISMSQEARPYTIFLFFALTTIFAFLKARRENTLASWKLFGGSAFLLLLTRILAPQVLLLELVLAALTFYCLGRLGTSSYDLAEERSRLLRSWGASAFAFLMHAPFLAMIVFYPGVSEHMAKGAGVSEFFLGANRLLASALFASFPVRGLIFLPILIIALAFTVRERDERHEFSTLAFILLAFPIFYTIANIRLVSAMPKPQYLIALVPLISMLLAEAIWGIASMMKPRPLGISAAFGIFLIVAVPTAESTLKLLSSPVKRDWRSACRLAESNGDAKHALFLGIAPSATLWSPPFYGPERYLEGTSLQLSLRDLSRRLSQGTLEFESIYIGVYRDYRQSVLSAAPGPLPEHIEWHDLTGLSLIRSSGDGRDSYRRLLIALELVARSYQSPQGYSDLFNAISLLHAILGEEDAAKAAYLQALAECTSDKERWAFFDQTRKTRQRARLAMRTPFSHL